MLEMFGKRENCLTPFFFVETLKSEILDEENKLWHLFDKDMRMQFFGPKFSEILGTAMLKTALGSAGILFSQYCRNHFDLYLVQPSGLSHIT